MLLPKVSGVTRSLTLGWRLAGEQQQRVGTCDLPGLLQAYLYRFGVQGGGEEGLTTSSQEAALCSIIAEREPAIKR